MAEFQFRTFPYLDEISEPEWREEFKAVQFSGAYVYAIVHGAHPMEALQNVGYKTGINLVEISIWPVGDDPPWDLPNAA